MRTQSARVCMLALGTIITNSFVHTPSYAIGSVSIVHRNEHPLSITASTSPEGSMTVMEDNLSVITDNEAGYSMYISTNSQTNYLASGNGDAIYSISSTTDSPAVLDRDSWGFAIPSTTDHAVISGFDADYEHLIASTGGKPSGLWAAVPVKSDMTLVQKTETNGAFDLDVRNRTSLTNLTYMQEMTPEICSNTTIPLPSATEPIDSFYDGTDKVPTKTLVDQRDGKTYTVSKLSDGNCWMTQNLYLGGEEELILTDMDTDVEEEFMLPAAQTSGNKGWKNDSAHVYDTGSSTTGAIYNWLAATAGVGTYGDISEETDQSICPRGWTLPSLTGGTSFTGLFAAYGWADRAQVVDQLLTRQQNIADKI